MAGAQLRINGQWASEIAVWGGLGWSTKITGGMNEIAWTMDVDTSFRHPSLRPDVLVEVFDGPSRLGAGQLVEPDLTSGSFTALGLYRAAEHYLCRDADDNGTSIPNVAIDEAIARGLPWKRRDSFYASRHTPGGDNAAEGSNYLSTLLDGVADGVSAFWWIDADGYVTGGAPTTTPTWYLPPGLTDLGLAEDEYASDLYGLRLASGGTFATEVVGDSRARTAFGRREAPVDLTSLGVISDVKAQGILAGLLAKGRGRPAFTESVEVSADQLLTVDGVSADLSMVQAGQMVRSFGFYDDIVYLNGATYLDWLIGETSYVDGDPTINLSPQGLAPRDLAAVLAAIPVPTTFRAI